MTKEIIIFNEILNDKNTLFLSLFYTKKPRDNIMVLHFVLKM